MNKRNNMFVDALNDDKSPSRSQNSNSYISRSNLSNLSIRSRSFSKQKKKSNIKINHSNTRSFSRSMEKKEKTPNTNLNAFHHVIPSVTSKTDNNSQKTSQFKISEKSSRILNFNIEEEAKPPSVKALHKSVNHNPPIKSPKDTVSVNQESEKLHTFGYQRKKKAETKIKNSPGPLSSCDLNSINVNTCHEREHP